MPANGTEIKQTVPQLPYEEIEKVVHLADPYDPRMPIPKYDKVPLFRPARFKDEIREHTMTEGIMAAEITLVATGIDAVYRGSLVSVFEARNNEYKTHTTQQKLRCVERLRSTRAMRALVSFNSYMDETFGDVYQIQASNAGGLFSYGVVTELDMASSFEETGTGA